MATTADLIARSSELKRELVAYAQQPRYHQAISEAMRAQGVDRLPEQRQQIMFLDYFALQHRLRNGKTVVDQFIAAHPDLSEEDRDLLRGWHRVIEGVFEVQGRDGDALLVQDLTDGGAYRVHSNSGPEVFDRMPAGCFVVTRLIPVGPDWLLSGATAVVPEQERDAIRRRAPGLDGR